MTETVERWQIAVVEDDDGLRSAILRMLGACRWEASGFASAEDFLRDGTLSAFDCMVLDLYLPGMSGFDLLDNIRKRDIRTPVILITAQDDAMIRQRVQNVGALFLPKPFSGQSLAAAVKECMDSIE